MKKLMCKIKHSFQFARGGHNKYYVCRRCGKIKVIVPDAGYQPLINNLTGGTMGAIRKNGLPRAQHRYEIKPDEQEMRVLRANVPAEIHERAAKMAAARNLSIQEIVIRAIVAYSYLDQV